VGPVLLLDELLLVVEASPPVPLDETLLVDDAAPPVPLDDETLVVAAPPPPEDEAVTPLLEDDEAATWLPEELDPDAAGVTDTPHAAVVAATQPTMTRRCDGIIERVFIRSDPPTASDPWPRATPGRISTPEPARAVP
jgi:hypothetical protein